MKAGNRLKAAGYLEDSEGILRTCLPVKSTPWWLPLTGTAKARKAFNARNSTHNCAITPDTWSDSNLAAQQELGLLPQRRNWPGIDDINHLALARIYLNRLVRRTIHGLSESILTGCYFSLSQQGSTPIPEHRGVSARYPGRLGSVGWKDAPASGPDNLIPGDH